MLFWSNLRNRSLQNSSCTAIHLTSYKTIQRSWTRHAGHWYRNKNELKSDFFLWTLTHWHTSIGRPFTSAISVQTLCVVQPCSIQNGGICTGAGTQVIDCRSVSSFKFEKHCFRGLTKCNDRLGRMARESQRDSCCRYILMMMMIIEVPRTNKFGEYWFKLIFLKILDIVCFLWNSELMMNLFLKTLCSV